jgi:hypothetical protein
LTWNFAQAALHDAIRYPDLLQKIMALGMRRARAVEAAA